MSDSSYYHNQMEHYKVEIDELTEKKKKYEAILPKINSLSAKLPELSTKLSDSEKLYLSGGFVSKEESFDRGVLKNCYSLLNNDVDTLSTAASTANNKIAELEEKIKQAKAGLETATANYQNALRREREEQ